MIAVGVTVGLLLLVCTLWYARAALKLSASAGMPKELTFMQKVLSPITSPMMSPKGGLAANPRAPEPPVRV